MREQHSQLYFHWAGTAQTLRQFLRMESGSWPILQHLGETFRQAYAWVVRGPVPTRWIALIEQLNAEEDAMNERSRRR
jgi:hypothetical protein